MLVQVQVAGAGCMMKYQLSLLKNLPCYLGTFLFQQRRLNQTRPGE